MAPASLLGASAASVAFLVVFALFVLAMVVLVVLVVVWAVRHDIAGRTAWRERQQARQELPPRPPSTREGT